MITAVVALTLVQAQVDVIQERLSKLRGMEPAARAKETHQLSLDIRLQKPGPKKLSYAAGLSNLATEGDCGDEALQSVADTLVMALKESPPPDSEPYYTTLATYARYEGVWVKLSEDPAYRAAMYKLVELEKERAKVNFSLSDLTGERWKLSEHKGKVVVVNFWATWCPPCRAEMPDLEALSKEFGPKGLVVLAITQEKQEVVKPFIEKHGYSFPILLDTDGRVNKAYKIGGIPNTFVYNRQGELVATGIDGRTRRQFLKLLARAGMKP